MADEIKIKVPDIGGAAGVEVIELLVKPGDEVEVNTPLITLESDKASMEIPSTAAGRVKQLLVKLGDKVAEGDNILVLEAEGVQSTPVKKEAQPVEAATSKFQENNKSQEKPEETTQTTGTGKSRLEVRIPDIGGATDVDVIDIMVKAGDPVEKDQALITLEGDKATMDIPSPATGVVESVAVTLGDKVSQDSLILTMSSEDGRSSATAVQENTVVEHAETTLQPPKAEARSEIVSVEQASEEPSSALVFAGPAVRRLARELGVDLEKVKGSGRKGRISKEDIQNYVKTRLAQKSGGGSTGISLPEMPSIDFSKFGPIESKPLNKIKRLTGLNVHRSWVTIPHVTQFDEADITELEEFRKSEAEFAAKAGYKLTVLAFVTKVLCKALQVFPQFNASLDGENLIYKHYFNIGIAVETPNGLVVPVIKQVDQLSVGEIALEMANLSKKARDKGLMPGDMNGGCFTISSLGGIGGTAFTPIVNSPEVAILGLSRSTIKPVFADGAFKPRLMLPLSLSYDHRVIDGAEAARFTRYIAEALGDIRRILL